MASPKVAKTYSYEKAGISVAGAVSAAEAKRQWSIGRDLFCMVAGCGPDVFFWGGFCAVVAPLGSFYDASGKLNMGWQWRVFGPKDMQRDTSFVSTCTMSADNALAAKVDAMVSIIQRAWSTDVEDDREFASKAFAFLVGSTGVANCSDKIEDFVRTASHWRATTLAPA